MRSTAKHSSYKAGSHLRQCRITRCVAGRSSAERDRRTETESRYVHSTVGRVSDRLVGERRQETAAYVAVRDRVGGAEDADGEASQNEQWTRSKHRASAGSGRARWGAGAGWWRRRRGEDVRGDALGLELGRRAGDVARSKEGHSSPLYRTRRACARAPETESERRKVRE